MLKICYLNIYKIYIIHQTAIFLQLFTHPYFQNWKFVSTIKCFIIFFFASKKLLFEKEIFDIPLLLFLYLKSRNFKSHSEFKETLILHESFCTCHTSLPNWLRPVSRLGSTGLSYGYKCWEVYAKVDQTVKNTNLWVYPNLLSSRNNKTGFLWTTKTRDKGV